MGSIFGRQTTGYEIVDPSDALVNQTFFIKGEAYTFIKKLGGGAFGSVWSAMTSRGYPAAVKTIDINRRTPNIEDRLQLMDSFEKEVKMAYKMRQETRHVVTIYGFDFDGYTGLALLAMELGGDTLSKRVELLHSMKNIRKQHESSNKFHTFAGGDYISPFDRKSIWVQLVEIVQTLHRHRVVHRDMKPDNLVFFGPIMKIVDLGIAQKEILGFDPTVAGVGTPCFSAPECFHRGAQVSSKADVWSAGAILYYMTYGQPPCANTYHPPPGYYPTESPFVNEVLQGCLQKNVLKRGNHQWLSMTPLTYKRSAL